MLFHVMTFFATSSIHAWRRSAEATSLTLAAVCVGNGMDTGKNRQLLPELIGPYGRAGGDPEI